MARETMAPPRGACRGSRSPPPRSPSPSCVDRPRRSADQAPRRAWTDGPPSPVEEPRGIAGPDGGARRQHELGQLRLLADARGRREVSRVEPGSGQIDGRRRLGRVPYDRTRDSRRRAGASAWRRMARTAAAPARTRSPSPDTGRSGGSARTTRGGRASIDVAAQGRTAGAEKSLDRSRSTIRDQCANPPTHHTDSCCAIRAARAAAIAASRARSLISGSSDCSAHRPRHRSRRLIARRTLDRRRGCAPDALSRLRDVDIDERDLDAGP